MVPKRFSFSLNPLWPHYAAFACATIAILLGAVRFWILDRMDPFHCDALATKGRWLDSNFKNWQPEGCMMHIYQPKDVAFCVGPRPIVFLGDSVTRQLFFQTAHIIDPTLPSAPIDDQQKHAHHSFTTSTGIQLLYYWDPFLNTSIAQNYLDASPRNSAGELMHRPAMLVLGSGLWYLRYASTSGGLPAWEEKIESTLDAIAHRSSQIADAVVILPVEDVIPSKLTEDRAESMQPSDIDAMNSDLLQRIRPPAANDPFTFLSPPAHLKPLPVSLPLVFNHMLDPSQTEDGLHFSNGLVTAQANILLNLRCNDVFPKAFPMDKTCCRRYPWPSPLHFLVLTGAILWGPVSVLLSYRLRSRNGNLQMVTDEQVPAIITSAAVALIYLADRTGFWLKEQKQFSPWTFTFLSLFSLSIGLLTVKRGDKDLGFLNREQTDEWKGWMQIAILIYHYLGASKISGIYNPIRVLVAAYLFMTGYGHTTYYFKKADFGLLRIVQVMVRLNLLTLTLAYTMNTDYISYYFAPLVSFWFLIIYATMAPGSQYNDRSLFLVFKILLSMASITWVMNQPWILETAFEFLERMCGIHWSAREWSFRVNLDLWIVYFGMFAAITTIKIREQRLTDHPQWPNVVKGLIGLSAVVMVWFFAFELSQPNKFIYNQWHPYISFLPIGAFVVLRNATPIMRSASSRAFRFIGTCSLETFIIQYHFWLAGDTKGILLVLPGTRWRPANMVITTVIFIYLSHRVAQATGDITNWICGGGKKASLPTIAEPSSSNGRGSGPAPSSVAEEGEVIFLVPQDSPSTRKDNDGNVLPPEPDTPARPSRRWVDRLAEQTPPSPSPGFRVWYGETEWMPGVKMKSLIGLGVMWVLNILWPHP